MEQKVIRIDAKEMYYKELNEKIYQYVTGGVKEIILDNINGQRYIGDGLSSDVKIVINGIAGNDLAAFMDGPTIIVNANGQEGIGNTMNNGKVIIHGNAGDILGHAMRGGKIFVKGDVGYRVGIHMKSYKNLYPIVVIGGKAGDFLGEYMAGGLIIVLGLGEQKEKSVVGNYCGTGMHGGTIYLRSGVEDYQLGKEVIKGDLSISETENLNIPLNEFCKVFDFKLEDIMKKKFIKLTPHSLRPYGRIYAY